MFGNEAIRQYHAEFTEDLHMLNLELQMIWFLCSSKIKEKLNTWTVNRALVFSMGHYQRKTTQQPRSHLKPQILFFHFSNTVKGNLSPQQQFIKPSFFFHVVTSHPSSSFHAPLFFRSSTKTLLPDLVLKPQSFQSSFSLDSTPQQPKKTGLAISNLAWNTETGKK